MSGASNQDGGKEQVERETKDMSYAGLMARRNEIMKQAIGINYDEFARGPVAFDYEEMMKKAAYSLDAVRRIQTEYNVVHTPLIELKNVTRLVREISAPGKGARIFVKDEGEPLRLLQGPARLRLHLPRQAAGIPGRRLRHQRQLRRGGGVHVGGAGAKVHRGAGGL